MSCKDKDGLLLELVPQFEGEDDVTFSYDTFTPSAMVTIVKIVGLAATIGMYLNLFV